jgi:hypothetical protein
MKKMLICALFFLMLGTNSLFSQEAITTDEMVCIECTVKPLESISKKHREPSEEKLKDDFTHRARQDKQTHPHIPIVQSTSTNWSGYVTTPPNIGGVSSVSGSWIIPTLSSTPNDSYCALWVGIDGFADGTVEQIGTEHDWSSGSQQNYAWFEMFPNPSMEIVGFPLNKNDQIGAEVRYTGKNVFQLTLVNYTQNVYTIVPTSYTTTPYAQRSSAEWILEAPYYNEILPLANFGDASFINCSATINGISGPIDNNLDITDRITMAAQNGVVKALPSALSTNGESFSVLWQHE